MRRPYLGDYPHGARHASFAYRSARKVRYVSLRPRRVLWWDMGNHRIVRVAHLMNDATINHACMAVERL